MEYAIGTQYRARGVRQDICTVIDILKTYNSKGELVKIRYVSTHSFVGQTLTDYDVVAVTIARGLLTQEVI